MLQVLLKAAQSRYAVAACYNGHCLRAGCNDCTITRGKDGSIPPAEVWKRPGHSSACWWRPGAPSWLDLPGGLADPWTPLQQESPALHWAACLGEPVALQGQGAA